MNKFKTMLSDPDKFLMDARFRTPSGGYISDEARRKAREKRKKKKK